MAFNYRPIDLKGPSFRLLRLCKGHIDDPIRCKLFETWIHQTDRKIDFAALSYTWGGTDKSAYVDVDGYRLLVTLNLWLALRHLRYQYQDRILWIDAICIDQDNNKERIHQVSQMASIYNEAERVVIWLGTATPETDRSMSCMKHLEEETIEHPCSEWDDQDTWLKDRWLAASMNVYRGSDEMIIQDLKKILDRPWFRRVWILQEVANARVAEIVCGSKAVSARTLALLPFLLPFTPDRHCQAVLDIFPGISRDNSWWAKSRDLRTLLAKFREAEASDPRDKIYALLSISTDASDNDIIQTDYEKSVDAVIYDTIMFLLGIEESVYPRNYVTVSTVPQLLTDLHDLSHKLLESALNQKDDAVIISLASNLNTSEINLRGRNGQTILHLAVQSCSRTLVGLLLERDDIQPNLADRNGRTALSRAAEHGFKDIVELLLGREDIDVNSKDQDGMTALAWAMENQREDTMKVLLSRDDIEVGHAYRKRRDSAVSVSSHARVNEGGRTLNWYNETGLVLQNANGQVLLSWAPNTSASTQQQSFGTTEAAVFGKTDLHDNIASSFCAYSVGYGVR